MAGKLIPPGGSGLQSPLSPPMGGAVCAVTPRTTRQGHRPTHVNGAKPISETRVWQVVTDCVRLSSGDRVNSFQPVVDTFVEVSEDGGIRRFVRGNNLEKQIHIGGFPSIDRG